MGKARKGASNPNWKGDAVSEAVHRDRALRWFEMGGLCDRCGEEPATDRHHKDGRPANNTPENIAKLCRRCHMEEDGRLARLAGQFADAAA